MGYTGGISIPSCNIAVRVDPIRAGEGSAREIDRGEIAIAHQQTMGHAGTGVICHDVAGPVDPVGLGSGGAREIDCSVTAPAQQKAMGALVG